ncbi:type 1 periplasmic-binding domain-containing protein [Chryseobacterium defluvii]|uniref:Uncharacterized protein n=1 Tax=Chryseobacterium defluvii TaxID=160396 RepID=A0A495SFA6_9FLAO|nr:hypothetical protein [Chryseobacterium defluvii]RKS98231.1 hypothetical protein BCF58_2372 [Chryseobacterium defluvii]
MKIFENISMLQVFGFIAGALVLRKILNTKVAIVSKTNDSLAEPASVVASSEDTKPVETVETVKDALAITTKNVAVGYDDTLFNPVESHSTTDVMGTVKIANGEEVPVYANNRELNLTGSTINTSSDNSNALVETPVVYTNQFFNS